MMKLILICIIFLEASVEDQSINQALLSSLDICNDAGQLNSINTTAVSIAELPDAITDSLNTAAKQLSLLCDSASEVPATEQDEGFTEESSDHVDDEIAHGTARIYSGSNTSKIKDTF